MAGGLVQSAALSILLFSWLSSAATTTTQGSATSAGSPSFPTITDTENTGAIPGGVGASGGGTSAGASGSSGASFQLSTGAVIGIAVAGALIIIAIVALWALWFTAKRQQITMAETLRRASRRLTGRSNPTTPKTPRPSTKSGRRRATMVGKEDLEKGVESSKTSDRSRSTTPERPVQSQTQKKPPSKFDAYMGRK